VGVDLERIVGSDLRGREELEALGLADVQHVVAEREQIGGRTENRAELTFGGPRRMLASWLAEPGPMGALDYVSPDANLAAAFVTQDLGVVVDELFDFIGAQDPGFEEGLQRFEQEAGIDVRKDLAAPLGGEFAVALDGPVLPSPSWKLILEVYDPGTFVQSLEWLVEKVNGEIDANLGGKGLALERETAGGREYFRLASLDTGLAAHFVFDEGYLVAGPSRALIDRALQNREMGIRLTDSRAFRDMLPRDGRTDFSGLFFQNVAPLVGPLSSTLGSMDLPEEDRQVLDALARGTQPMVALLYGESDRIVFTSSSEGGLLGSGLNSLTGVGGLLGMQQSLARVIGDVEGSETRVDVQRDVKIE
jgi:hypothetical protein